MAIKSIFITTRFNALHKWENVPFDHPSFFLRNLHRHCFFVRIEIEVNHKDREIEFYDLSDKIGSFLKTLITNELLVEPFSCEDYCEAIALFIKNLYGKRAIKVEVSEE